VVGFLHSGVPDHFPDAVAAFHQGLSEAGYVKDHNVAVDFRWANGNSS
jgi:putative ABC transport system substrate-binding protein